MTITLTTIGSRNVTIDIEPAALPEAAGGIGIHCGLYDRPLIFTLTAEEASQLAAAIADQLDRANAAGSTSRGRGRGVPAHLGRLGGVQVHDRDPGRRP